MAKKPWWKFTRRTFMAGMGASGLALSLGGCDWLEATLKTATDGSKPPVIWIQGASCTGCSISLLNSVSPGIAEVLLDIIDMRYHSNIMAAAGNLALAQIDKVATEHEGEFFLVVEGSVPLGANGLYSTMGYRNDHGDVFGPAMNDSGVITFVEAVTSLGKRAKAIIAAGTCATNGGIPAGRPNPTEAVGVDQVVKGTPIINIPNCPIHPDRFIGTLAYVLTYNSIPALDAHKRPKMFYANRLHDKCHNKPFFEKGQFATKIGEEGCLYGLGCAGMIAMSDCSTRWWNNKVSWCVLSGAPCIGCSEPDFPDMTSPFFEEYIPFRGEKEREFLKKIDAARQQKKGKGGVNG